MSQRGRQQPNQSIRGSGNASNSVSMPPPTWVGASGRVYHEPPGRRVPPFLGMRLSAPMLPHPVYPAPRRFRIPHPSIVDEPVKLVGNMPIPQSPPRVSNSARPPPPMCVHMRILTGTINQIREWTANVQDVPTFEVTGYLYAIGMVNPECPPAPGNEINLLLRDRKTSGPILQVIHPFHLFPEMPQQIETGQLLRCVGRVLDARRMLAIKITIVPPNAIEDYSRVRHVCSKFTP